MSKDLKSFSYIPELTQEQINEELLDVPESQITAEMIRKVEESKKMVIHATFNPQFDAPVKMGANVLESHRMIFIDDTKYT